MKPVLTSTTQRLPAAAARGHVLAARLGWAMGGFMQSQRLSAQCVIESFGPTAYRPNGEDAHTARGGTAG